jgi:hypothetical protein
MNSIHPVVAPNYNGPVQLALPRKYRVAAIISQLLEELKPKAQQIIRNRLCVINLSRPRFMVP